MTMSVMLANASNWKGQDIEVKIGDGPWESVPAARLKTLHLHPDVDRDGKTITLQIRKAVGGKEEMFKNGQGTQTYPELQWGWTNGRAVNS